MSGRRSSFYANVRDVDGLWGGLRVWAEDEAAAEREMREHLDANELEPAGSLNPGYTLELAAQPIARASGEEK